MIELNFWYYQIYRPKKFYLSYFGYSRITKAEAHSIYLPENFYSDKRWKSQKLNPLFNISFSDFQIF